MNINKMLMKLIKFKDNQPIEVRVFHIILLVGIGIGLFAAIGNTLQGLNIVSIINALVLSVILSVILLISIFRRVNLTFLFCIVQIISITIQWIYNGGGSSGGIQYFFLYTYVISAILLGGWKLVVIILLNSAALIGLLLYEYLDGSIIVQYPDQASRLVDIVLSAMLTFILAGLLIRIIYSELNRERVKSEKLLANILPRKVILDLNERGITLPELFSNVTVLFSDVVGFTEMSSRIPVNKLIEELNDIFTTFDLIMERNGCERIKTIGDAYLAVSGLPEKNAHHCENIANAALEMIEAIKIRNVEKGTDWQIRIGIHTGEVIGSVIGIKKYIYDVFGDTVNTASRFENSSEPMKINISQNVFAILADKYNYEERGKHRVKGKGDMSMYFLEDKKL